MSIDRVLLLLFSFRRWFVVAAVLLTMAICGREPLDQLRARLPDPLNDNPHIAVLVDGAPPAAGTPFVTFSPSLRVIGIVEGVDENADKPLPGDTVVRVSLFPAAQGLLRDDARLQLRVTTPDLLEIVANHFTRSRREALAAKLSTWYAEHRVDLLAATDRVRELATEHLGADELGRALLQDPALRTALANGLTHHLVDPIDWEAVLDRFVDSPAGDAAGDYLRETRISTALWRGVREGYAERFRALLGGQVRTRQDPDDDARLQRSILDVFAPADQAYNKAALASLGDDLKGAFSKHQDTLGTQFKTVGSEVAGELELDKRAFDLGSGLLVDEGLRNAITQRHGPQAWERVEKLAEAMREDELLQVHLKQAVESGLELSVEVLRDVLVDESGSGPNPLVVALVRARVLRRLEPLLVLEFSGVGNPVSEGQRFKARTR